MVRLLARLGFVAALGLAWLAPACHSMAPANGPETTCRTSCHAHAARTCDARECSRGCELILDRVVEREGDAVIACVARSTRGCSDTVWAECAAHVGSLADGGPPAPVTETFPDEE